MTEGLFNGNWTDWSEALPRVKEISSEGKNYEVDNFSIKAYVVETTIDDNTGDTTKVPKVPKTGDRLIDFILQLFV